MGPRRPAPRNAKCFEKVNINLAQKNINWGLRKRSKFHEYFKRDWCLRTAIVTNSTDSELPIRTNQKMLLTHFLGGHKPCGLHAVSLRDTATRDGSKCPRSRSERPRVFVPHSAPTPPPGTKPALKPRAVRGARRLCRGPGPGRARFPEVPRSLARPPPAPHPGPGGGRRAVPHAPAAAEAEPLAAPCSSTPGRAAGNSAQSQRLPCHLLRSRGGRPRVPKPPGHKGVGPMPSAVTKVRAARRPGAADPGLRTR